MSLREAKLCVSTPRSQLNLLINPVFAPRDSLPRCSLSCVIHYPIQLAVSLWFLFYHEISSTFNHVLALSIRYWITNWPIFNKNANIWFQWNAMSFQPHLLVYETVFNWNLRSIINAKNWRTHSEGIPDHLSGYLCNSSNWSKLLSLNEMMRMVVWFEGEKRGNDGFWLGIYSQRWCSQATICLKFYISRFYT